MCVLCHKEYNIYYRTKIDCHLCDEVRVIPLLPDLESIECSFCYELTTIPILPNLEILSCVYCLDLTSISELPKLKELDCSHCDSIITIPKFPKLERLDCLRCPLLYISIELRVKFGAKSTLIGKKIKRIIFNTLTKQRLKSWNKYLTLLVSNQLIHFQGC